METKIEVVTSGVTNKETNDAFSIVRDVQSESACRTCRFSGKCFRQNALGSHIVMCKCDKWIGG